MSPRVTVDWIESLNYLVAFFRGAEVAPLVAGDRYGDGEDSIC